MYHLDVNTMEILMWCQKEVSTDNFLVWWQHPKMCATKIVKIVLKLQFTFCSACIDTCICVLLERRFYGRSLICLVCGSPLEKKN